MKAKLFIFVILVAAVILLFLNIFLWGSMNWGDAPHFWPEELGKLISEPLAWTNRGINLGGNNFLIWISPMTILIGLLYRLFNFSSNLSTAIVFYTPGIVLSLSGAYLFARSLKLGSVSSIVSAFLYVFNTYFLLLIDGGQVGIVLAYGIFPFSVMVLRKFSEKRNLNSFFIALIVLFVNSVADPRIAMIAILTLSIWLILEGKLKQLLSVIPLIVSWVLVNSYWVLPLLKNKTESVGISTLSLQLTSILHPLFLFSPHWPGNLFGKVQQPYWYFVGMPILIFAGLILNKSKKYITFTALFLIFVFLTKGNTNPLGQWYNWVISLPFGFAFRDSSKFFTPTILFAAVLIGNSVQEISKSFGRFGFKYLTQIVVILYLILLVLPSLKGNLNFILSDRSHSNDYEIIYNNLKNESGFARTVWLPERHPLAFNSEDRPAVDAYTLTSLPIFKRINAGEDWFNFFYNPDFVEWFKLLGFRYLILSDDPRTLKKSEAESKNWQDLSVVIAENKGLEKVNWGTDVAVYKVKDTYPRFYISDKIYAIVGSDKYKLGFNGPVVFFEDGVFDPYSLQGKDPNSVQIVFEDGLKGDNLTLSFLQKYFVSPSQNTKTEWAVFNGKEYLKSKYELIIRKLNTAEMDYGRGVAFSTKKGEKIEFTFDVENAGDYVFAKRFFNGNSYAWDLKEINLPPGKHTETITNEADWSNINLVALIPKNEFEKASNLSKVYLKHFKSFNAQDIKTAKPKINLVEVQETGTLKYKVSNLKGGYWLILNENYNQSWQLRYWNDYYSPLPVYSTVNGFYIDSSWTEAKIEYSGQQNVRWGIYVTAISWVVLAIIYFWRKTDEK